MLYALVSMLQLKGTRHNELNSESSRKETALLAGPYNIESTDFRKDALDRGLEGTSLCIFPSLRRESGLLDSEVSA